MVTNPYSVTQNCGYAAGLGLLNWMPIAGQIAC